MPIGCEVDLQLEPDDATIRLEAVNISMSGMFLRSNTMVPPGTTCTVAFELDNDSPPIRARAEVLWTRERDKGPDRPKGIGIRFLELELDAKYAISRLVEQYNRLGEMPFQLPSARPAPATSTARTGLAIGLAFLAGLTVGSLGSLWWLGTPDGALVEPVVTAESPRTFAPPPATGQPGPGLTRDTNGDSGQVDPPPSAAIASTVDAWARAWSDKDVAAYLAFYSERFETPAHIPLDAWRAQRRERLSRPGFIEVTISSLEIEPLAPDRAIARFEQSFASPGYRDRVAKLLELAWEGEAWRVVREETLQQLDGSGPPFS